MLSIYSADDIDKMFTKTVEARLRRDAALNQAIDDLRNRIQELTDLVEVLLGLERDKSLPPPANPT